MYSIIFLVRYFPFWSIPMALVFFELAVYHFNRRARIPTIIAFGVAFFFVIVSIIWIIFEGYWRAGPMVKHLLE